jgi:hypothetical protein
MMNSISNFHEVRRDGQIVSEQMTSEQIDALGDISRVVEARWVNSLTGKDVSITSKFGVLAHVVDGRNWVAALVYETESRCNLKVFDSRGDVCLNVPNIHQIANQNMSGSFTGFAAAHHSNDAIFGVIFRTDAPDLDRYWMDVDALTGKVLTCTWTK